MTDFTVGFNLSAECMNVLNSLSPGNKKTEDQDSLEDKEPLLDSAKKNKMASNKTEIDPFYSVRE